MLIFLYDVISRDCVMSLTLKTFMKFWGTCFKFWLRPLVAVPKESFITQFFSPKYCETFHDSYFEEHLWTAASHQSLLRETNDISKK